MKVGTLVIAGMLVLCAATAITVLQKEEAVDLTPQWNSLQVYKNKLMYSEAIDTYKDIIGELSGEEKYNTCIELKEYCKQSNEVAAYIEACKIAVQLNPSDYESAEAVLNNFSKTKDRYSYIHQLMDIKDISQEARTFYNNYYDSIKGTFSLKNLNVTDIGEWDKDSYSIAAFDDENDCVISSDGTVIVEPQYGKIDSYSSDMNYIAVVDKEQKVYTNLSSQRKLVPYDYNSNVLVYYDYLGKFENGMANFRTKDNKWGYLNTSMNEVNSGFEMATPLKDGLFAVKSGGKWTILYKDSFEVKTVYTCDDIYTNNTEFVSRCFTNSSTKQRMFMFYSKTSGNSGWRPTKLIIDFSKKEVKFFVEQIGSAEYEDVKLFGNGIGSVKQNGKWCFIDLNGAIIEKMGTYPDVGTYNCGFCPVMNEEGEWGYIDGNGKMIIEPQFTQVRSFSSLGTAPVNTGTKWQMLRLQEYK